MKITRLHIENFRSIKSVDVSLEDTTVFIGPNNSGKSAILEAMRIALSRRWGLQGTGFTEADVYCKDEKADPRKSAPVRISFLIEEPQAGAWPTEMVTDLGDIVTINQDDLSRIAFSVTYSWDEQRKAFEPGWEFLDSAGKPLPLRRRSMNLSSLFNYILFFWLGALRDADDEFASRSRTWGGLLRTIQIPEALEKQVQKILDSLDSKLLAADPKLAQISSTIGQSTEIASGDNPGSAKLRMLPINIWDLLSRAGILLRNEDVQPWLPLDHHGQGLQSLSVIFLLQAAILQRLSEEAEGAEPIIAIEEPEVHLHPQAARTLWHRVSQLPGQKLVTTHSPYFVQHVPLHCLRVVRFVGGSSTVAHLPKTIVSGLQWTTEVDNLVKGKKITTFVRDSATGCIGSIGWFDNALEKDLLDCFRTLPNAKLMAKDIEAFRHSCRVLVYSDEEKELAYCGRRLRGEIFFAREWVLVEGPCEYLLLHAIGQAHDYDLDQHGIAVIDFQNGGNAAIYPALADAFRIPWTMITDGDPQSEQFKKQLMKRGFNKADLKKHFFTHTVPNDLEKQLLADGHETLLREVLLEAGVTAAKTCSLLEMQAHLGNRKTAYMRCLAPRVAADRTLASKMPSQFISFVESLLTRNK